MELNELQVNEIYDIKYKTINLGDKVRWLHNLKLIEIGEEHTVTNCRCSFNDRQLVFIQQSKRPIKFYISKSEIYYIRKHFN